MPLKFKIALFVVLLTVVVTAVAGVLITGRMESALRREIEMRGEALARNLAANVEDPLSQGDDLYIARFTTGAMDNADVVYAVVVGEDGRIAGYRDAAHDDFTPFLGKPYESPPGVEPLGKHTFLSQTYDASEWGPLYDVAVPPTRNPSARCTSAYRARASVGPSIERGLPSAPFRRRRYCSPCWDRSYWPGSSRAPSTV